MEIFNQISERVEEFIVTFLTNDIWRIMLAVVVMVIVVLLKSFISRCVFKLIERSMTDKGRVGSFVDDLIKIVDRPLRLVIISAGIYICHMILRMPDVVRILVEKTVSSLLLFAVFWGAVQFVEHLKGVLTRVTEKSEAHLDNIAVNYLVYALKALVIIFGGLSILQIWVGNISSLIAGLSIGGVAFALAAQDTAANLFGSITVMLDHPFEIGEYIEIDGIAGTVERMGLRSTRIRTSDQSLVIVPNKTMSSVNITNWTKIDRRRVMFTIGVTYSDDSRAAARAGRPHTQNARVARRHQAGGAARRLLRLRRKLARHIGALLYVDRSLCRRGRVARPRQFRDNGHSQRDGTLVRVPVAERIHRIASRAAM